MVFAVAVRAAVNARFEFKLFVLDIVVDDKRLIELTAADDEKFVGGTPTIRVCDLFMSDRDDWPLICCKLPRLIGAEIVAMSILNGLFDDGCCCW